MPCLVRKLLAVCLLLATLPAFAAVQRWDSLPALDVQQWRGPYAGQTVCPMCRHGYDAGVLMLLPDAVSVSTAAAAIAQLRDATRDLDDPRFRIFVVTLDEPEPHLRAALSDTPEQWFVGTLHAEDRGAADAAFGQSLGQRGSAHVFSQRRSLRYFDPSGSRGGLDLAADIVWAREVLRYAYGEADPSTHPDTPKGMLWSAPSQPSAQIIVDPDAAQRTLCIADGGGLALVGLRPDEPRARPIWARTDARGCLPLQSHTRDLSIELFPWRAQPMHIQLAASRLDEDPIQLVAGILRSTGVDSNERLVGGPCDGCEAVFTALPDRLPTTASLTEAAEPGEPLRIRGRVLGPLGKPRPGVVVYAYQTDAEGRYPPAPELSGPAARHGRLRGWALSDEQGHYGFDTVRPASYPDSTVEQHVHMHVIEPRRCTYYLGNLLFDDDPMLSALQRERAAQAHAGSGIVQPTRGPSGWVAERDIHLGLNVASYADCAEMATPSSPAPAPSARLRPASP
jgi:protocatechuate 3,4-dioxygenase beta subunit